MKKLFFALVLTAGFLSWGGGVEATSCGTGNTGTCMSNAQCGSVSGSVVPDPSYLCAGLTCCIPPAAAVGASCPAGFFQAPGGLCLPPDTGLSGGTLSSANNVTSILTGVGQWLLAIVGVLAILIFAICGTKYLIAAGQDKMIEDAKTCMTWSIVGVAVAISGLIIIRAVDALLKADTGYF